MMVVRMERLDGSIRIIPFLCSAVRIMDWKWFIPII